MRPSVRRPMCPYSSFCLSLCLSVHPYGCLSVCPFVSLFFFLSFYLLACLSVCLSFCLSANQFVTPSCSKLSSLVTQNKRPVVFSILGCTQPSRRPWFNGWWHPVRSVWQSDSKGRRPQQRWLPRYIWKPYVTIGWLHLISRSYIDVPQGVWYSCSFARKSEVKETGEDRIKKGKKTLF